ncbi:MAG: NAD(P)H-dependent oxidoreductase subunit E, partial [Firmicutes bacterium]|nr:NAD(P)H-dependent oxidoreductase subunit E [Bacillota bacterium]
MKIASLAAFHRRQTECARNLKLEHKKILVCGGTGCVAGGSMDIYARFQELIGQGGFSFVDLELETHEEPNVTVKKSGCHGFCEMGPLVRIEPYGILYVKVKPEDADEIFQETIIKGKPVQRLLYTDAEGKTHATEHDIPFYKKQRREVLEHCGAIDAESIAEYIALGGYTAFTADITDALSKENTLVVRVHDDTDKSFHSRGKQ